MSGLNRRHALGGVAAVTAAPLLAACGDEPPSRGGRSPSASDEPGGDEPGGGGGGPTTLATADVPEGSGVVLADHRVVVTQPKAGQFKAFSAVCTHQGCLVSGVSETIDCSCHGSKFSLADGAPVGGPATSPLGEQAISVKGDTITLG